MSDSVSMMPEHPPVTDWVNDFDHTDPRWTENPFPIWDELRANARWCTPSVSSAAICRPPIRR